MHQQQAFSRVQRVAVFFDAQENKRGGGRQAAKEIKRVKCGWVVAVTSIFTIFRY